MSLDAVAVTGNTRHQSVTSTRSRPSAASNFVQSGALRSKVDLFSSSILNNTSVLTAPFSVQPVRQRTTAWIGEAAALAPVSTVMPSQAVNGSPSPVHSFQQFYDANFDQTE